MPRLDRAGEVLLEPCDSLLIECRLLRQSQQTRARIELWANESIVIDGGIRPWPQ